MLCHCVKAVKNVVVLHTQKNHYAFHNQGYLQVNKRCNVIMLRQSKKCLVKTFLKNLNRGNNKDITYYHSENDILLPKLF